MSVTYSLSAEQREQISEFITEFDFDTRLELLAGLVADVAEQNDVGDVERLAHEIGTREVVGTGMNAMTLGTVLEHLVEFEERTTEFEVPEFGGQAEFLEDISGNHRFDHSAFFALQQLYGRAIHERVQENEQVRA